MTHKHEALQYDAQRADLRQNGGDDVEQTDVKQEIDQQAVLHTVHLVPGKSNGRGAVAGPDIAVAINRFLTIISLT